MSMRTIPQQGKTRTAPPEIGRIIDEVCAADRRYFEDHPHKNERLRPYVDGEIWPEQPPQGTALMILVQHIAPGVRCRVPIVVDSIRIVEDDSAERLPL